MLLIKSPAQFLSKEGSEQFLVKIFAWTYFCELTTSYISQMSREYFVSLRYQLVQQGPQDSSLHVLSIQLHTCSLYPAHYMFTLSSSIHVLSTQLITCSLYPAPYMFSLPISVPISVQLQLHIFLTAMF